MVTTVKVLVNRWACIGIDSAMASVAMQPILPGERDEEQTPSEDECDLMIDALRRELDGVRVCNASP